MDRMKMTSINFVLLLVLSFSIFMTGIPSASAGNPYSGSYCVENNKVFWFIQTSDVHVGARGTRTAGIYNACHPGKRCHSAKFYRVSGDLTDSTNGNLFGYPDGPHQEEWDLYRNILSGRVDAGFYYDLPGIMTIITTGIFSIIWQTRFRGCSNNTQASWTKTFDFGKYHFMGINTADNTDLHSVILALWDYAGWMQAN